MNSRYDFIMEQLGYEFVDPESAADVTQTSISTFEEGIGYSLPRDYKEFILRYGGTMPQKGREWIINNEDGADEGGVDVFYSLASGSKYDLVETRTSYAPEYLPASCLLVAASAGGSEIVMKLCGPSLGSVYWWHHERRFSDDAAVFLAKTFDCFMKQLVAVAP